MIFISHRGNLNGIKKEFENSPEYIDIAIKAGFDVEIDLRMYNNKLFLGHDEPQYQTSLSWILKRRKNIWIHAKDFDSLCFLKKINKKITYFTHQNDDFALISNGLIWCHKYDTILNENCIVPLISEKQVKNFTQKNIYAACSDFVIFCKDKFNE